jgi:hypothetical protein
MKPISKEELEQMRRLIKENHPNEACFGQEKTVQKVRGLGDIVAAATSALGIKPCGGCKRRQSWLNKLVKFR